MAIKLGSKSIGIPNIKNLINNKISAKINAEKGKILSEISEIQSAIKDNTTLERMAKKQVEEMIKARVEQSKEGYKKVRDLIVIDLSNIGVSLLGESTIYSVSEPIKYDMSLRNLTITENRNMKSLVVGDYDKLAYTEIELIPKKASTEWTYKAVTLTEAFNEYIKDLEALGFTGIADGSQSLKVYAKTDSLNAASLNVSHNYGESFLAKGLDSAADARSEMYQLFGGMIHETMDMAKGAIGSAVGDKVNSFISSINKNINQSGLRPAIDKIGRYATMAIKGNRINFPKIWKGGDATTNLSFNVKIGPLPIVLIEGENEANRLKLESYKRHILGPLAALILLSIPRSTDGVSYSWPYYLGVRIPGVCEYEQAAISSLSVTPIEHSSSPLSQIPSEFEININVMLLENSIVHVTNPYNAANEIPNTLDKYLSAFIKGREIKHPKVLSPETIVVSEDFKGIKGVLKMVDVGKQLISNTKLQVIDSLNNAYADVKMEQQEIKMRLDDLKKIKF